MLQQFKILFCCVVGQLSCKNSLKFDTKHAKPQGANPPYWLWSSNNLFNSTITGNETNMSSGYSSLPSGLPYSLALNVVEHEMGAL
jgi:hypothetical protein